MNPFERLKYDYLVSRREIGEGEFAAIMVGDGDLQIVLRDGMILFVGPDWLYLPEEQQAALLFAQSLGVGLCDNCQARAAVN
jgi:hypothetical protein